MIGMGADGSLNLVNVLVADQNQTSPHVELSLGTAISA
jgi:hypothetical protein